MCNENFEVETDELWNSIEQCMGDKSIGDNDEENVLWIEKSIGGADVFLDTHTYPPSVF